MGHLVQTRAQEEGHEIVVTLAARDAAHDVDQLAGLLRGLDAAIDFSVGGAVLKSATACAVAGVPLVEGTTG